VIKVEHPKGGVSFTHCPCSLGTIPPLRTNINVSARMTPAFGARRERRLSGSPLPQIHLSISTP
jgi:hypothetical protein